MFFGLGHPGRQMLGMSAKSKVLNSASLSLDFMTPGVLDPRITFTRASSGTYFDSAGVMQTAGYNLIRNNTQVGAVVGSPGTLPTNWIVTGSAGLTTQVIYAGADYIELRISGTPNNTLYTLNLDSLTLNTGQLHTLSGYTALVGGTLTNVGSLRLIAGGSGGFNAPWNTTSTLTRVSVTWNATIAAISPQLSFNTTVSAAVDLTVRLGLAQLEQAPVMSAVPTATTGSANGAPRWDYDPSTLQLKGLLIEEARTNLFLNSTVVSAPSGAGITANVAVAPDGTTTGDLLFEGTGSSFHVSVPGLTLAASTVHTISCYAKQNNPENRYFQVGMDDGGGVGALTTFDLQTGIISGQQVKGAVTIAYNAMQPVGNGWYRCTTATNILTATAARLYFGLAMLPNAGFFSAYQGLGSNNGVLMWGIQVEVGGFPSSYIPTTGSAVTRAIDVCSLPTNVSWYNAAASSLFAEYTTLGGLPDTSINTREGCVMSDGTTANRLGLRALGSGTSSAFFYSSVSGAATVSPTMGPVIATPNRLAGMWNGTVGRGSINGGVITNYSAAAPVGLTTMTIGNQLVAGTNALNGYIRRVTYWNRALTDGELQAVTA